jgi:ABC-2 type transport system permease protein
MLSDIWTIMQKEWKEMLLQRPNLRGGWVGLLVLIGVFGIFLPFQNGPGWINSPANLFLWAWVPFLLVSGVVADSFAGERERHTLETLLASRLSDRAILLGKVGAAMAYGWGLTILSILLGLITVNVVFGKGELLLYPLNISLGILGLTILIAVFAAALGVLVSLRSSTVRQAQQGFNFAMLLFLVPILAFPMLPDGVQNQLLRLVTKADMDTLVAGAAGLLLIVDAMLIAAAMARFKRAKLILD